MDGVEMKRFIGLTILIGACKSKNENVLQLQIEKDLPLFTELRTVRRFRYSSSIAFWQCKGNSKWEPVVRREERCLWLPLWIVVCPDLKIMSSFPYSLEVEIRLLCYHGLLLSVVVLRELETSTEPPFKLLLSLKQMNVLDKPKDYSAAPDYRESFLCSLSTLSQSPGCAWATLFCRCWKSTALLLLELWGIVSASLNASTILFVLTVICVNCYLY